MKFIKTPVKGMCDMLPADMRLREHILQMIKTSYASYGFMQIETPVMEHIENLTSKQGGDNEKLIFKVMKRGADLTRAIDAGKQEFADNGLRYDLTVPLARYYANNKEKLPTPFKALQIGKIYYQFSSRVYQSIGRLYILDFWLHDHQNSIYIFDKCKGGAAGACSCNFRYAFSDFQRSRHHRFYDPYQ